MASKIVKIGWVCCNKATTENLIKSILAKTAVYIIMAKAAVMPKPTTLPQSRRVSYLNWDLNRGTRGKRINTLKECSKKTIVAGGI